MGLHESLNTEQAIVSSLQHNDLIKLHLEQHETSLTENKMLLKTQCRSAVCSCSFINQAGTDAEIVCRSKC